MKPALTGLIILNLLVQLTRCDPTSLLHKHQNWRHCSKFTCHQVSINTESLARLKELKRFMTATTKLMESLTTAFQEELFRTAEILKETTGPYCKELQPILNNITQSNEENFSDLFSEPSSTDGVDGQNIVPYNQRREEEENKQEQLIRKEESKEHKEFEETEQVPHGIKTEISHTNQKKQSPFKPSKQIPIKQFTSETGNIRERPGVEDEYDADSSDRHSKALPGIPVKTICCRGVQRGSPYWVTGLDDWCEKNCMVGFCPSTHCTCTSCNKY